MQFYLRDTIFTPTAFLYVRDVFFLTFPPSFSRGFSQIPLPLSFPSPAAVCQIMVTDLISLYSSLDIYVAVIKSHSISTCHMIQILEAEHR